MPTDAHDTRTPPIASGPGSGLLGPVLVLICMAAVPLWHLKQADKGPDFNFRAQEGRVAKTMVMPVPAATEKRVPPRVDPKRPVSQPAYPPASRRLGETGTVTMLLTVAENGRVIDAALDTSSGHDLLDQAALKEAKTWRLAPGTINGNPATMRQKFRVVFGGADQQIRSAT